MSLVIEKFVTTGFGRKNPAPNSQKNYRNHISQFEGFLKDRNKAASDGTVTDQDVSDYLEYLKAKYQQNTVAVKIAAVKSYFKWLKKEGALTHYPEIRSQRGVKVDHKELKASDLDAIVKTITGTDLYKQRDLATFSLIVYCGFKTSEVVATNVEDVAFDTGIITIGEGSRPFRAAFAEMAAYKAGKFRESSWKAPEDGSDEKEPFFLNKHSLRISTRSVRRRLLGKSTQHTMRDLRHTYLKNLDRINQTEPVEV